MNFYSYLITFIGKKEGIIGQYSRNISNENMNTKRLNINIITVTESIYSLNSLKAKGLSL